MKKVLLAYAVGGAATLLFLALFYAVFADIALLQQNAVAHLSKYATALTPLGRVDLLFVIALTLVMVVAAALPVRLCALCLQETFGGPPALHAGIVCALLLGLTVLLNPAFREAQALLTEKLWPVFALFGYALPLLCALFLWDKKEGRSPALPRSGNAPHGERGARYGGRSALRGERAARFGGGKALRGEGSVPERGAGAGRQLARAKQKPARVRLGKGGR